MWPLFFFRFSLIQWIKRVHTRSYSRIALVPYIHLLPCSGITSQCRQAPVLTNTDLELSFHPSMQRWDTEQQGLSVGKWIYLMFFPPEEPNTILQTFWCSWIRIFLWKKVSAKEFCPAVVRILFTPWKCLTLKLCLVDLSQGIIGFSPWWVIVRGQKPQKNTQMQLPPGFKSWPRTQPHSRGFFFILY